VQVFLLIIFLGALCGDLGFALAAIVDVEAATRPSGALKVLAVQADLLLLGVSVIATAISGFGFSMLDRIEQMLAQSKGAGSERLPAPAELKGAESAPVITRRVTGPQECPQCGEMTNGMFCRNCGFEFRGGTS
jgi:hypothetical protein